MSHDPVIEALEAPVIAPPLDPIPEPPDDGNHGLARATTILAIGNMASRVLGFVKEILLSNYFGPGVFVDAFQIAITIPQDFYDLAISGHVNSALVPVLSEYATRDRDELWRLWDVRLWFGKLITKAHFFLLGIFGS